MDESFVLLSSMSPKINRNHKPVKNTPTKLALKKNVRKSLNIKNKQRCNESIISLSSTSSEKSENLNQSPIVISDSDCDKTPHKKPIEKVKTKDKMKTIEHWIDAVNNASVVSGFSEVSTVLGEDNPFFRRPQTNIAVNSTQLEGNVKRFDELFKIPEKTDSESSIISNSLTEDNMEQNFKNLIIDDSFKLTLDEDVSSTIHKKSCEAKPQQKTPDHGDFEDLLDSLYGNSWREKKDEILPSSECKIKPVKTTDRLLKTERPIKTKPVTTGSNLIKVLEKARFKKALESPWSQALKRVCDSDTDKSNSDVLSPRELNFDSSEEGSPPAPPKKEVPPKLKTKSVTIKKKFSFLASLSNCVPVDQCDISALIFRNHFKQHKETLASRLFQLYNEKVFDNSLPKDTVIEWNNTLRGTAGKCVCKKITRRTGVIERTASILLSQKVLDSADRLRDTLIHELCHAATWIINQVSDGHGAFWKAWASRAMKTFPELPPIKRCHDYIVQTKYSYKCNGCGYTIGRHTKSLDTKRKVCGYCKGTFEVLINKTSKKGETKSVPATPKKPNQFALFVKENYGNFKTPELNHGDVMKLLSRKFADLKVENANKS